MAHTPGLWRAVEANDGTGTFGIVADGACLAECFTEIRIKGENARAECAANALLIAAAPRLLELLRALEISANTVSVCYGKRPENFAAALTDLDDMAAVSRELIAVFRNPA